MIVNPEKSLPLVMIRRNFWIVDCEHKGDAMNKSTMAKIYSKIYCEKVKMCWFSSIDWFFLHQICATYRGW
jgi:hypothetical protein